METITVDEKLHQRIGTPVGTKLSVVRQKYGDKSCDLYDMGSKCVARNISLPQLGKVYFGFSVADSMFGDGAEMSRKVISPEMAKSILDSEEVTICLNPSHEATIDAMKSRFGIGVDIPKSAPQVKLEGGDRLIVMSVRGLPRLDATRHEYTQEEIASASFEFSLWSVQ